MIRYRGRLVLFRDGSLRNPLPNPSRSILLGDPATGSPVAGCTICANGHELLAPGMDADAIFDVVSSEFSRNLPERLPLWYGKVIGEASGLVSACTTDTASDQAQSDEEAT